MSQFLFLDTPSSFAKYILRYSDASYGLFIQTGVREWTATSETMTEVLTKILMCQIRLMGTPYFCKWQIEPIAVKQPFHNIKNLDRIMQNWVNMPNDHKIRGRSFHERKKLNAEGVNLQNAAEHRSACSRKGGTLITPFFYWK